MPYQTPDELTYETSEAITDPDFSEAGAPDSDAPWIIEADSGWVVDAAGIKHTVPGGADDDGYTGPHVFQAASDMADPFAFGDIVKIVVVAEKFTGGANIHVHINPLANLLSGEFGSHVMLGKMQSAGTYEFYAAIPRDDVEFAICLFGMNGTEGGTAIVNSISVVKAAHPVSVAMSGPADPTATKPIPVIVKFGESVTEFEAGDIDVTNGTVAGFAGSGDTYTFNLVPASGDLVVVTAVIPSGVAVNANGIPNSASARFSRTYYAAGVGGTGLPITFVAEDLSRIVPAED